MNEKRRIDPEIYPYLSQVDKLKFSYPSLGLFISRILNRDEEGRRLVDQYSVDENGQYRPPGRCCVLEFRTSNTRYWVQPIHLRDVASVQNYLELHSPTHGDPIPDECHHRMYILEDLAPEYVELLGRHLRVDPVVLASQMNSWRFLNTGTIAQRTLPSLADPKQSFTLRYPELRCFDQIMDDWLWTFAANRRKIDPWYPIPGGRVKLNDELALVRRCLSFWVDNPHPGADGWNALLLVDPAVNTFRAPDVPTWKGGTTTYRVLKKKDGTSRKHPQYDTAFHSSRPFHYGHPDPISVDRAIRFTAAGSGNGKTVFRRKAALFDEAILYWTQKDNEAMIKSAIENPVNTTNYVLKVVAYHWTNLLELILLTMNQAEFVADEGRHPENFMGDPGAQTKLFATNNYKLWKKQISQLYVGIWYFNIFRRRMAFYEDDLDLAIEALNPRSDASDLPEALKGASIDFQTLQARLRLYKARADMLASTADEIVNLRSAAKSLDDSAFNLRLAIFAAIVFPGTFIAALFGMSDGYKPGDEQFWIFWVVSVPLIALMIPIIVGGSWLQKLGIGRDK